MGQLAARDRMVRRLRRENGAVPDSSRVAPTIQTGVTLYIKMENGKTHRLRVNLPSKMVSIVIAKEPSTYPWDDDDPDEDGVFKKVR